MFDVMVREQLVTEALQARERAYARYSNFHVGAALLAGNGKVFTGTNVENVSYGLTICAERSAVFNAVSAGERTFLAIAIAAQGPVTPCGACRQVLAEFAEDLVVLLVDADKPSRVIERRLRELLPFRFTFEPDGGDKQAMTKTGDRPET